MFDRALAAIRRARARRADPAGESHFLRAQVVADLFDRLTAIKREFPLVLSLGDGGAFARTLADHPGAKSQIGRVITADIAGPGADVLVDHEHPPFAEESLDLVVSALSLHTVNDLPGALALIRRALKPDGLFIGALFGGASLTELRQSMLTAETDIRGGAGLRVAPMADSFDLAGLLQRAGFALPVADSDRLIVRYATPLSLLQDLRAMGETAAMADRSRTPLTRGVLMAAMADYQARFSDPDGKVRATAEIVWATGWAPHDSQQKPLRPGSATTRLADALGVTEHSAGEKAGR